MICTNELTKKKYNYQFVEDGKVKLENNHEVFTVPYEDWCNDYYVIDKLKSL